MKFFMIVRDDDEAMNDALIRGNVSIKKSPIHGYGVFAEQDFHPGDIIEECYVLPIVNELRSYCFDLPSSTDIKTGIATGSGSIFNHSDHPNADYNYDPERQVLVFESMGAIKPGEEIFIHYGDDWFSSRKKTPVRASRFYYLKRPVMLAVRFGLVMMLITGLLTVVDHWNRSAQLSFAKISSKQIQKQAG